MKHWKEYFNDAIEALNKQQYAKSIDATTSCIKAGCTDNTIYEIRFNCYHFLGQYDKCIIECDKFLAGHESNYKVRQIRANCYYEKGNIKEAEDDLNRAILDGPSNGLAYSNRGALIGSQERYEEALIDFDKAESLGCDDMTLYRGRAMSNFELGNYLESKRDFDRYLLFDDQDVALIITAGEAECELKNYDAGIKLYDKAISLEPEIGEGYYRRMHANLDQKNYEIAQTDANIALKLNADYFPYEKDGKRVKITSIVIEETGKAGFNIMMNKNGIEDYFHEEDFDEDS